MMVGRGILTGMRRDSFPEKGVFRGKTFFSARFFFSKSGFWGGFHPDSVKKGPFGAHY